MDRDEARDELEELNEEAEMTHEELLKKSHCWVPRYDSYYMTHL